MGKNKKMVEDDKFCRQIFCLSSEYERRARMCAAYNGMSKQRWYERIMERAIEQEYKKIIL